MTQHKFYIGSVGPFIADDSKTYSDGSTVQGFKTTGQIIVQGAPTHPQHVARLGDVQTAINAVTVASISSPVELRFKRKAVYGSLVVAYERYDRITLYLWSDSYTSTSGSSPYVMPVYSGEVVNPADVIGYWIAATGFYVYNPTTFTSVYAQGMFPQKLNLPLTRPASYEAGSTYFEPSTNYLYIYNGTAWRRVLMGA